MATTSVCRQRMIACYQTRVVNRSAEVVAKLVAVLHASDLHVAKES